MTQQSRPSWLSSFGDYGTYVRNLTASDPRLSQRDPKLVAQKTPWETAVARAVVFHKSPGGKKFSTPVSFDKAPLLSDFLSNNQLSRDPDGQQLIIVEGLNPAFAGALGSHFRMDPSFFVEQMRVIVISAHKTAVGDGPVLPSLAMAREHMTLKYYESLTMPDHVARTFKLCCADSGRHLGVTRVAGQFSSVGMLRRKCSVWRRRRQGGKGWDVVLLTDPPLREVQMFPNSPRMRITPVPLQGGYVDFIPHDAARQTTSLGGPPRSSMADDLCFYLRNHEAIVGIDTPEAVELLVKKIVASHYMQHLDYITMIVSHSQWVMSRHDTVDSFNTYNVEAQWSDAQALGRRIAEYCSDLEWIMLQCKIPFEGSNTPPQRTSWKDTTLDYQFLYMRYTNLRTRAESLNASMTALMGMVGNQQSVREARRTRALTVLGLMFIPLAYVSSLFSMADEYLPGRSRFWLYFAVSLPLILLVFATYVLVDNGLLGRTSWLTNFGKIKSAENKVK